MDQSSIERALTSLIPAHNGPLPSKLVERATSLLAQSRSKASNLKAEEEIARVYVCANLACERYVCIFTVFIFPGLSCYDQFLLSSPRTYGCICMKKAQANLESTQDRPETTMSTAGLQEALQIPRTGLTCES